MKTTITVEKEVEIKFVSVDLPVRYGEEGIPKNFPMRDGDMWGAVIDIDTGQISDWPPGQSGELHMKVCDGGTYELLDEKCEPIAAIEQDYVPNALIPGDYGDYVHLIINGDGVITNWPKKPSVAEFFNRE